MPGPRRCAGSRHSSGAMPSCFAAAIGAARCFRRSRPALGRCTRASRTPRSRGVSSIVAVCTGISDADVAHRPHQGHARRPGGRRHPGQLRPLRFLYGELPDLPAPGDELDGPRGRIYLIKSLLEGHEAGRTTQIHLDRCLGCRACETACPRALNMRACSTSAGPTSEWLSPRPLGERLKRLLLCRVLPYPRCLRPLLRAAQLMRPLVPHALRRHIPEHCPPAVWPVPRHARAAGSAWP